MWYQSAKQTYYIDHEETVWEVFPDGTVKDTTLSASAVRRVYRRIDAPNWPTTLQILRQING